MYVQYSPEVKTQAIELHNTGKPIATISKELGISESTLHRWFSLYSTPQSITEEDAIREITRLIAASTHDILGNLPAPPTAPPPSGLNLLYHDHV